MHLSNSFASNSINPVLCSLLVRTANTLFISIPCFTVLQAARVTIQSSAQRFKGPFSNNRSTSESSSVWSYVWRLRSPRIHSSIHDTQANGDRSIKMLQTQSKADSNDRGATIAQPSKDKPTTTKANERQIQIRGIPSHINQSPNKP